MASNDSESESEKEAPKHLPLNEEELAVLEFYLEQWDSASSEEKNKTGGIEMVSMQVYRKWLQNHGEKKDTRAPINLGRKKKELLKQIEDETGVKPREKEIMKYYSKYLAEMVNSLTETEVEEASEMAMQWNKMGVPLEFKLTQPNRKVGRFSDTWPTYFWSGSYKEVEDDPVVKKGGKDNTSMLEIGINGVPVLPDHETMDLDTRKAVVQAFLNWHHRACNQL
ncbi:hypothetical protein EV424DRAFT_1343221 [Suillus variegatus]|nr:hypothetical protein EV424DRAFT_1343221 [Suillus variegatus]